LLIILKWRKWSEWLFQKMVRWRMRKNIIDIKK
jgi:hypothetical protein